MKKYTVGGLFVGIGGVELGFKKAGMKVVWANEFDKNACKTYRANFNHILYEEDIHKLDPSELESVDIITGGFPCQAFSVAGNRKGFSDPRGNLFFEIVRIIEGLTEKPKALLLENVKNFYSHDNRNTYKVVHNTLEQLGYSVFTAILNTADHSDIPQNRERTFIVCFRNEVHWRLSSEMLCSTDFDKRFPPKKLNVRKHIKEILFSEKVDSRYYYTSKNYMYKKLEESIKSRDRGCK
ncbi:MAG: DNA cytosine methyltransferase [Bacteroidetes bacterium]|nr:DNA cytosine methyltransferase [Bacteroidota bacterium]